MRLSTASAQGIVPSQNQISVALHKKRNPAHGSVRMLQVLSTYSQKQAQPNPLHGSAGMIQVLPVDENSEKRSLENPE